MDELMVGLTITVVGLGVVFIALTTVYAVLTLFIQLERRFASKQTEALPQSEPASPAAGETIPPEILAAIVAAVTVAIGKKVRLKRVRYHSAKPETAWSTQGRATIMASHVVKR